jgi:8-oxo-dGTP pyrophosphatase MutT (NUDIX family)
VNDAAAWPAIAAATAGDEAARVPFRIDGHVVGSVARDHLGAVAALIRGDARWSANGAAVALHAEPGSRDAAFADLNAGLRAAGLIRAWRDEPYPVFASGTATVLARLERASSRFWGTLTLGAHANGWVAGDDGRPAALWIAQRALTKPTDPGMLDNLVGGGVPAGQSPRETLVREGWEEAGLERPLLATATPGRVIRLARAIPEGWQHEWLYSFDLRLPAGVRPVNQDGEVAGFRCLPVAEAIELARGGAMTVDAALVTLDFALRHGLLGGAAMEAATVHLWLPACPIGW